MGKWIGRFFLPEPRENGPTGRGDPSAVARGARNCDNAPFIGRRRRIVNRLMKKAMIRVPAPTSPDRDNSG